MINPTINTQGVESIYHSISPYVPEGEKISMTISLKTKILVACYINIIVHFQLWTRIYYVFILDMGKELTLHYEKKDKRSEHQRKVQNTRSYKIRQKNNDNSKYYLE